MLACILGESGEIYFPKLEEDQMVNFKDITVDFFKEMAIPIEECESELFYQLFVSIFYSSGFGNEHFAHRLHALAVGVVIGWDIFDRH